ncbi:hypothetical protein Ndes2526A_g04130 [Nannochloris sp. 'desiccata']
MLLPVPDILLDSEASKLCNEIQDLEAKLVHLQEQAETEDKACSHLSRSIDTLKTQIPHNKSQLNELTNIISLHNSALELKRREAAHAKEFIAAQHAQQASLDALALRFENDCLKSEDRLEELENLNISIKNDYNQWNLTEDERKEVIDRAVQEGKVQSREMAELHRQLEASSIEAATANQACKLQKSNTKTSNMQVENIRKALSAAQEEAAVLRRRLDETELALVERTTALEREARSAIAADEELIKARNQVEIAKGGLDAELAAGKELSMAAASAERRHVDVERRARTVQSLLNDARQDQKVAQMELRQRDVDSKQAKAFAQAKLAQAGHSARYLAELLQKHREMEEAIEGHETVEKSSKERQSVVIAHVKGVKQQNDGLDKKIAELSKQKIRLQQERESLKERCLDRETVLSDTQAQSNALDSKAEKLREQLQHHEGALYRVDFQLLMAKRAAALATLAVEPGIGLHNQSPASRRVLKQELQTDLEKSRIAQKKTKSNLRASTIARENAQMAVDRASMTLARSQKGFADKARTVLQLSAAVEEGELSFKNRASELENKLQELSVDHHAAVNALQASKNALTPRTVAVSTASATLSTLQLKTQLATPAETEERKEKTATTEGGVAGVCAELQRQVEELQAALATAEADCDVLEHALTAQKEATALANRCKLKVYS